MVDVKLDIRGLNKLMTSAPVQAEVDRHGERLAASAGEGFEYSRGARSHPWTARGFVQTTDVRSMRRQAREAALERALGSA